jgi:hypothetical protein
MRFDKLNANGLYGCSLEILAEKNKLLAIIADKHL